jgi:osmotically inducible protein OsmC
LETKAAVKLEQDGAGFTITRSDLTLEASVPGITPEQFEEIALAAKANCPVSKLFNAEITLTHTLV